MKRVGYSERKYSTHIFAHGRVDREKLPAAGSAGHNLECGVHVQIGSDVQSRTHGRGGKHGCAAAVVPLEHGPEERRTSAIFLDCSVCFSYLLRVHHRAKVGECARYNWHDLASPLVKGRLDRREANSDRSCWMPVSVLVAINIVQKASREILSRGHTSRQNKSLHRCLKIRYT
jgi:hypothetical protein